MHDLTLGLAFARQCLRRAKYAQILGTRFGDGRRERNGVSFRAIFRSSARAESDVTRESARGSGDSRWPRTLLDGEMPPPG